MGFARAHLWIAGLLAGCLAWPDNCSASLKKVAVADNTGDEAFTFEIRVPRPEACLVKTPAGTFSRLYLPDGYHSHTVGHPQLPTLRYLFALPTKSETEVRIANVRTETLPLTALGVNAPVCPAQPSRRKSPRPGDDAFRWNKAAYAADTLWPATRLPTVTPCGAMRGVGIAALTVSPVRYNPVQGVIEIVTAIDVTVSVHSAKRGARAPRLSDVPGNDSPYFSGAFSRLANWSALEAARLRKADLTRHPVTMLIVAHEDLRGQASLNALINWKRQKGFNVIERYVTSSHSVDEIDGWIESTYAATTPRPSFLLLIGDESGPYTVATENPPSWDTSGEVSRSDLRYSVMEAVASSNHISSLYCGRMSVRTTADLDAQVAKTLWYEHGQFRTAFPDLNYLKRPLGVAGHDEDLAASHGNPQISYGWTHYFNASNGMENAVHYLHPDASSRDSEIRNVFSEGVSFYNYTAHGYEGGFADPSFSVADVSGLTNSGRYGLVLANCCLTGSFGEDSCFGEALLTAPNKGAVGYIGASVSSLWNEDLAMAVGTASVVNQVPPAHSPNEPGIFDGVISGEYPTQGGAMFAGLLAVERYGSALGRYWAGYHLFGDPSLSIYWGIPETMAVSHPTALLPGPQDVHVNAPANALVSLYSESPAVAASALTDASGKATISVNPINVGETTITVTHPQYRPYEETLSIIPPDTPWLSVQPGRLTVSVPFGSATPSFPLAARNIGVGTITYTAGTDVVWMSVTPGTGTTSGDANTHTIVFDTAGLAEGDYTGTVSFASHSADNCPFGVAVTLHVRGPALTVSPTQLSVTTEEGSDAAPREISIRNSGLGELSYTVTSDVAWARCAASSGTSTGETDRIGIVFASAERPVGQVSGTITIDAGDVDGSPFSIPVSLAVIPDFSAAVECESFALSHDPAHRWETDIQTAHDGVDAGRSSDITDDESSSFGLSFTGPGVLSFWWRVSSEPEYDLLVLRVDGEVVHSISGYVDWTQISYHVPSGSHDLTWTYEKDGSESEGHDCGWVDQIVLTAITGDHLMTSSGELDFLASAPGEPVAAQTLLVQNAVTTDCSFAVSPSTNWLTCSPSSGSSSGQSVSLAVSCSAAGLEPGLYEAELVVTSPQAGNCPLTVPVTLEVAPLLSHTLDQPQWVFSSTGEEAWRGTLTDRRDASGFGQSGDIEDSQESGVSCTLHGPGELAFWWRVSSEDGYDYLEFRVDGTNVLAISGETAWERMIRAIPAGAHEVSWVYGKDSSVSQGRDCGQLDTITWNGNSEPIHRPSVTAIRNSPTGCQFSCESANTVPVVFRLQYRGNLTCGDWQDHPDGVRTVSTGQASFDVQLTGVTQRFFRVTSGLAP